MKIKFTDQATDQDAYIEPIGARFEVEPLGFDALCNALKKDETRVEVVVNNVLVRPLPELPGTELDMKLGIRWDQPVRIFTLLSGGWLPPLFSRGRILFPDRNILTHVRKSRENAQAWHSLVVNETASAVTTIDPLLCALEGRHRRTPSRFEFRAELSRARRQLEAAWPDLPVFKRNLKTVYLAYSVLLESRVLVRDGLLNFLLDCQMLMTSKPAARNRPKLLNQLFVLAARHYVSTSSLTFTTVLALLYADDSQQSFAAEVLKFYGPHYSRELAYNALSDIQSLEFLLAVHRLAKDDYCLVTGDRWLALLWCALNVRVQGSSIQGGQQLSFSFSAALLPTLSTEERNELATRCGSCYKY